MYVSSNNVDTQLLRLSLHFSHLHFTPLHFTCRHFTSSHLNFTQLHFTTLSVGLTLFKFPTTSRIFLWILVEHPLQRLFLLLPSWWRWILCLCFKEN